jgi:hypothetical protein
MVSPSGATVKRNTPTILPSRLAVCSIVFGLALRVWKPNGKIVGGWRKMDLVKEEVPEDFRRLFPSGVSWTLNPN